MDSTFQHIAVWIVAAAVLAITLYRSYKKHKSGSKKGCSGCRGNCNCCH